MEGQTPPASLEQFTTASGPRADSVGIRPTGPPCRPRSPPALYSTSRASHSAVAHANSSLQKGCEAEATEGGGSSRATRT